MKILKYSLNFQYILNCVTCQEKALRIHEDIYLDLRRNKENDILTLSFVSIRKVYGK